MHRRPYDVVFYIALTITKQQQTMEIKTFSISGMKCEHCRASVANVLRGLGGVHRIEVSLTNKNVIVEYDESIIDPMQMKASVDSIGRFEMQL